jgi:transposase
LIVPSPLLSIVPAALEISRVLPTIKDVTVEARLARMPVTCPACSLLSRRLHSYYRRVLRDLPW